ncbi:MAG TPA: hypothetical protein PKC69_03325 [Chitinophagaceae bacterium]|nr:hypothetical protein [Chitinophagaceae bacterium]
MLFHPFIRKSLILCFMAGIGYAIAKSIDAGSVMGAILSIVSLASAVYFLYVLKKAREQQEESF